MTSLGTASLIGLLVIWLVYPAVIRLLAMRPRRPGAPASTGAPSVSVVLASRDPVDQVEARVRDLLAARFDGQLEIVVGLDGNPHPSAAARLQALDGRVRVVNAAAPGGKALALDAAVAAARHETLVFADTAQRFDADAIQRLANALRDPSLGAVSGRLELPGSGGSLNLAERYWRYESWLRATEARVHSPVGVTGCIYAMRRSLWKPLPAGLILDDLFVPMRLVLEGWHVGFVEDAVARDVRRFEAGQEFRRKVRTLTGVLQVCAWLPGVLDPRRNALWLQFVFHKLLRLLTPYLAIGVVVGWGLGLLGLVTEPETRTSLLVGFGLVVLGASTIPPLRRALVNQLRWGLALPGSAAVATWNGMRGRWNVWQ